MFFFWNLWDASLFVLDNEHLRVHLIYTFDTISSVRKAEMTRHQIQINTQQPKIITIGTTDKQLSIEYGLLEKQWVVIINFKELIT